MPTAPRWPCRMPGCPQLQPCPVHKTAWRVNPERGTTAARGYGARHRRWRQLVLARDPVCRACGRAPSTVADHVVSLAAGGDWTLENGQGMCRACHAAKSRDEGHR